MSQTPRDLAAELARSGRLTPLEAALLGRSLSRQLAQGHRIGAVYGVLSPFAVRVHPAAARGGSSRSTEYRLANPEEQREAPSDPMCRAPELAAGAAPSAASDVFALGAVVLQATTGRRGSLSAGLPVSGPRSVPDPLWQVLVQLTQPDPQYRPSVEEAESMFAGAYAEMRDMGVGVPAPDVLPYQEHRESSRAAPIVVLVLILAVVAGIGYYAVRELVGDNDDEVAASTDAPDTETQTGTQEPNPEPEPTGESTPTETETETESETEGEDTPTDGAEYDGDTILPNADEAAFVMPSGNVWCRMFADDSNAWVTCSITEKSYVGESDDPQCDDGNAITMVDSGPSWTCTDGGPLPDAEQGDIAASWLPEDGTVFDGQYAALDYDATIELGPLSCTSRTDGLTCSNADSGSSFTLAREAFEFN